MFAERILWAKHIEAIANEGIHTKGYAEREGLDVSKLYKWRQRLDENNNGLSVSIKPGRVQN